MSPIDQDRQDFNSLRPILAQITSHQATAARKHTTHSQQSLTSTTPDLAQPPQSWPTHLVVEQQQAEHAEEDLVLVATEAETVDVEGAADVVGLAAVETRAKRRNGSQ